MKIKSEGVIVRKHESVNYKNTQNNNSNNKKQEETNDNRLDRESVSSDRGETCEAA